MNTNKKIYRVISTLFFVFTIISSQNCFCSNFADNIENSVCQVTVELISRRIVAAIQTSIVTFNPLVAGKSAVILKVATHGNK